MTLCQAVYKSYPHSQCCLNAKFGDFCGNHRIDKPEKTNLCQGITKKGKKCTQPVKRGHFCHFHIIPEQPDHDWSELRLYNPDINWPNMSSVLYNVKKVKNGKELWDAIETYNRDYYPHSLFPVIDTHLEQIQRRDNKYIILMMQTFFVNYYIDYDTPHWQNIVAEVVKKTENVSWLKEYHLLFRKKFDVSFREQTKKNYIEKVFVQGGGIDIAKKIVSFM
jgi:hypothetical protein